MNITSPKINYSSRDFSSIREDLINWAKSYHPDKLQYFNENNPDILYLEMVAYVGDILSYNTDKVFNENFKLTAQARESLIRIADNLGFYNTGPSPSETQVVLEITVPYKIVSGVTMPDPDYLIKLKEGMTLQSDNGELFEITDKVLFSDESERKVIPNLDSNGSIRDYTIKKYAIAKSGQTKIQSIYIDQNLSRPFLTITLNDKNITEIVGVVGVSGYQNVAPSNEDFFDIENAYFEVRELANKTKFVEQSVNDDGKIKQGITVEIPNRFIVRRDVNDIVSITFGNNSKDTSSYSKSLQTSYNNEIELSSILTNTELGNYPEQNTTLFVKYRTGGGSLTNITKNQLNTIISKEYYPSNSGINFNILQTVRKSLKITNNYPSIGGKDVMTTDEIKNKIGGVYSSQDRGVTYSDIINLIEDMPSRFGRPFRISYKEIPPNVANYSLIKSEVENKVNEMLGKNMQSERQSVANELFDYLDNFTINNPNILPSTESLWIGEKTRLYIISKDEDENLVSMQKDDNGNWYSPQERLKENIRKYLLSKRIIGDWIEIYDANINNFQVEVTISTNNNSKQSVALECINRLKEYFNINNWNLNQNIYVSNVITALQEITSVLNIVDIKFYNIFNTDTGIDPTSGLCYTPQEIGRYFNISNTPVNNTNNKFEMIQTNGIIYSEENTIFELKYPDVDIKVNII